MRLLRAGRSGDGRRLARGGVLRRRAGDRAVRGPLAVRALAPAAHPPGALRAGARVAAGGRGRRAPAGAAGDRAAARASGVERRAAHGAVRGRLGYHLPLAPRDRPAGAAGVGIRAGQRHRAQSGGAGGGRQGAPRVRRRQ